MCLCLISAKNHVDSFTILTEMTENVALSAGVVEVEVCINLSSFFFVEAKQQKKGKEQKVHLFNYSTFLRETLNMSWKITSMYNH